jgi:pyruvate-ferredoxin/flavodoxin oxidoreductase
VMVCPHAVIRSKVYAPSVLDAAPATFKSRDARLPDWRGLKYTLQVAVEDCTVAASAWMFALRATNPRRD